MPGIRNTPYPSKYQINFEGPGQDKYWSTYTSLDDLLLAKGQHVKTYADISHLAKGLAYAKMGTTESTTLSPLMEFVTGDGGVEVIDKNFARWRVYGRPDRRAISFGNLNDAECAGAGGLPFKLFVDVDWFEQHDVLAPADFKMCQVVIQSEQAVPYEGGFMYDAVLLDEDQGAYIPPEVLRAGAYWIKMNSVTSWEKAATAGTIQFGEGFTYLEWEVPLTTSMWKFEIFGEAHRQWGNLEVTRCDEEGRPMPDEMKITNYHEAIAMAQIQREKELMLSWGQKTEHLLDKNSGEQITTSPGLFTWLAEGNVIPYDPEAQGMDFISDIMEAHWFDRVSPSNRETVFLTGTAGLKLFSDWVAQKFNMSSATYTYDYILQRRTPFDDRGGRRGFAFAEPQFVEYLLPTFGSIRVAHWPILDNVRINSTTYPGSIYPASSYEFIAFNTGLGEPNVKFLSRVDNRQTTYIPGLWSPLGATGQGNPVFPVPSYVEDSYKWIHRESYGVVVLDPSSVVWFKPNVSY